MKRFLASVMLLCSVMAFGAVTVENSGAKPGVWTTDYEAAFKAAQADKGSVMMLFTGSDWCRWCKLMDKEVFSKPGWPEFAAKQGMYLVFIDFPQDKSKMSKKLQEQNQKLQEEFRVQGYPTMLLMDGEGNQFGQLSAARNVSLDSFKEQVQKAMFFAPANLAKLYKTLPEKAVKEIQAADHIEIKKILVAGALLDQKFPEDGKEFRKIWNEMKTLNKAISDKISKAQQEARKAGKEVDWEDFKEDIQKFEASMGDYMKKLHKLSKKVIR